MDIPLTKRAVRYQYGFGVVAGMAAMTSGAWLAWASSAVLPLEGGHECCNMTKGEISTMVALMDLGNILTPIPTSYFMDWFGRKPTLYSSAAMNIIGSVLCLLANDVWYLYMARIFAGMAKGVAFAVVPIFLAEVANVQIRGALSTMFIGFLNIGMFYDYVFGWVFPYKGLNIANLVIPIVFSLAFFFVPESPYYLMMKKKKEKSMKSLATYRQVKADDGAIDTEISLIQSTVEKDLESRSRFWDVVGGKSERRAVLIIAMLATFQRASGISPSLAYMTVTLPDQGGGLSIKEYMIIFSFILVVANYVATPLIDNWGRKKLLIYSAVSSAVVQGISGTFYFVRSMGVDVGNWNWVPYLCLILFAFTYSLGIGFIPSTLVGELFPTNIKCYASSISVILLAATSFLVNRVFREVPTYVMYWFFSAACICCAFFCVFLVFETKGKTFVEIQEELRKATGQREGSVKNAK